MGAVFYVIAIMGCGDGSAQCDQARVEPAQYATMAQCRAAMPGALARNTDMDYPAITAACRPIGQKIAGFAGGRPRG